MDKKLQEMDPGAAHVMEYNDQVSVTTPAPEDIFGNLVIFKNILEQLPNSKLLELSLVSKDWKKQARIVLKKRGNVMALLKSDEATGCGQVLEAFVANLETLNETLYSGMTIRLDDYIDECEGTGALEVERIHEILTGMRGKLKRLSIWLYHSRLHSCWNNPQVCPSSLLIRILLRDFIWDLEHLTLDIKGMMPTFIQEFLPHGLYPKLKVVRLSDEYHSSGEAFGNQIRLLLSRAPNLQEVHTRGEVRFTENLMEAREGVVLVHESDVDDLMEDISENIIPALRLKRLEFYYYTTANVNLDRWNEKAPRLLRRFCAATLEHLRLGDVAALLFMSYGIQLVNVNELKMELDFVEVEQFQPRILGVISRFDYTYLLPNLIKVSICMRLYHGGPRIYELPRDEMEAIIEQASAVPMEPTLPRAANIKFLEIHQEFFPAPAVQFFANMFPAIQELEIWAEDFSVEFAWELWPELKLMKVHVRTPEREQRYQRP